MQHTRFLERLGSVGHWPTLPDLTSAVQLIPVVCQGHRGSFLFFRQSGRRRSSWGGVSVEPGVIKSVTPQSSVVTQAFAWLVLAAISALDD